MTYLYPEGAMTKSRILSDLCEGMSLDQLLKQDPESPRRDFHFDKTLLLSHTEDFNIIVKKVDTFFTMNHCIDPWVYIVAQINKTTFIDGAKIKVKDGEIRVSNDTLDAGFNNEGKLTKLYKGDVKPDPYYSRLEDIYIKGCSQQLYNVLKLTFK